MMLKTKNYGLPDSLIDVVKKVVQEAKLHPNQQKLDVHEPEKDKLTADDFKKLRGGKKEEAKDPIKINPKLKEEAKEMEEVEQIDERNKLNEAKRFGKVQQFAAKAHEVWRKNFDPSGTKERIKKNSDGTEGNINVPFNKLHPDWKKENIAAGHAALAAVKKHPNNMEKAAEHVHNEWMKRNPKADYNADQHKPYSELSDAEKEKDRVHVRTMQSLHQQNAKDGIDTKPKLKEEEQIDEASHGYKLKLTKTTHPKDVTDDQDEPVKATEKHYEVHQNDKKVGNILHHYNDYGGHFYDADLHGKKVPYDRSKGGEGAHNFLKSVVNTKFHSNLKKEEVEQVGEGSEDKKDTAKLVAMMMGKKINKPEKPKDSNVTTHTGKQTYDAGSDDEPETPKRKSGPQGPMKRRFVPKSKLRMQFK